MEGWTRVAASAELLPGEHRVLDVDGTRIAVFNLDGVCYAIEDVCTHDGGELTGGLVDRHIIECPRHGARFDIRTGEVLCAPAYTPTASFPVRMADGVIWTRDDRWD